MPHTSSTLDSTLVKARKRLLTLHHEANSGHIGSCLSCIDVLTVLYNEILKEEDYCILSKGHAAAALYTAQWTAGLLSNDDLATFAQDGTILGMHPPTCGLSNVPFGTGSLGHGPSLSSGLALGRKLQNARGHVYCVTSDGEWQEGSCWEALIFMVHNKLDNLTIMVDVNGLQAFGTTKEVASMDSMEERFRSFGADVNTCNGHDPVKMMQTLSAPSTQDVPRVILLETCKGKGLPFFEDRLESHYLPLTEDQYAEAMACFGKVAE